MLVFVVANIVCAKNRMTSLRDQLVAGSQPLKVRSLVLPRFPSACVCLNGLYAHLSELLGIV